jgi:basic membrane protein A
MLVQAGATGTKPSVASTATPSPSCAKLFHIAFVTDVAGLRSRVDADGWQGVGQAVQHRPCARAELITSGRPSDYRRNLQLAVDHHNDLVIAGSFLLSEPVVDAARANPDTSFVPVDPILVPPRVSNLAVLIFREDEAVFLAGALAEMVTRKGIIAGIYGPAGALDVRNRSAFETGAHEVRDLSPALGAYQPPDQGPPYDNPAWGASQGRAFIAQGADVIFGAGGSSGDGALLAADDAGAYCIALDPDPSAYPAQAPCLIASTRKFIAHQVELEVLDVVDGRWAAGDKQLGIAKAAVALNLTSNKAITGDIRHRLTALANQLGQGH